MPNSITVIDYRVLKPSTELASNSIASIVIVILILMVILMTHDDDDDH